MMRPRFISKSPGNWMTRMGWFVGLWAASVLALAVVASLLRALMRLAGMS